MTTVGVPERQSEHCNAFDIGVTYTRKFAFYDGPWSGRYAVDLEAFDSIELIVVNSSGAKVEKFTATVLTATAQKEADANGTLVANKCTVNILPSAAAGDYRFHIIGRAGAVYYQLARLARTGYYAAPAVT